MTNHPPPGAASAGEAPRRSLPVLGAPAAAGAEPPEVRLAREGWTRRFVAAPPRLEEAVALYRSLGFSVRQEPLTADELDPSCTDCAGGGSGVCIIFTRGPT